MKAKLNNTPRTERTLEYYFAEIMETIIAIFIVCAPDYDRSKFMKLVYTPLQKARISGDHVLYNFSKNGDSALSKGDAALFACIYCIESGWARFERDTELAWSHLMEAQRYVAIAVAEDVSEPQLAKILDLARTEAKSKAGRESVAVSVQPWREAKQEAIRLIRQRAHRGQQWASAEEAASEIVNNITEFLKAHSSKTPKKFWSEMPEKTIAGWLRELPEADKFFVRTVKINETKK